MEEVANNMVGDILSVLSCRKGFDSWWDNIDEEIKEDIFTDLMMVIKKNLTWD